MYTVYHAKRPSSEGWNYAPCNIDKIVRAHSAKAVFKTKQIVLHAAY